MPSLSATVNMRAGAIRRIMGAAEQISSAAGIEPPVLKARHRDREYLHAKHLEALAEWAELVADALNAEVVIEVEAAESQDVAPTDEYADLSKDEVLAAAEMVGMTVNSRTTKTEALEYLLTSTEADGDDHTTD